MTFEEAAQIVDLFLTDFLSYWNYYFPVANKTPSPSVTANLVDVTSAQIKDSASSEVQEVKSGLSPKAKIYIATYVFVAIVCFVVTGYYPVLKKLKIFIMRSFTLLIVINFKRHYTDT